MAKANSIKTPRGVEPCDVDEANIALLQARAILDLLTVLTEKVALPGLHRSTLHQSIYAAMSEVERARVALLGDVAVQT